eukprot:GHRR01003341.1.p2 GENE.GHRR01003341.1~~GHRR01003341.1.p2  ORF type:complete len:101 (+),score=34.13 GHRR01003341.1:109-411(+)
MADEDRQQLREEIAQEKYGKPFEELDSDEKMSVGGTIGGRRGGEARKKQMAEEHGGDVHAAYSEMGSTGAKKGGYSTGYAHDPEKQKEFDANDNANFPEK